MTGSPARRRPRRSQILGFAKYLVLSMFALILVLGPLWVVLVNSWKTFGDAQRMGLDLPTEWALVENYASVFKDARIPQGFKNSLVVSISSIIPLVLLGSGAAWVFARSTSRMDKVAFYVVAMAIFIPSSVITTIALFKAIGLYGGHPGLIVFYIASFLPITIFLITGFIRSIPLELEDAARIDGCGHFGVFFRIILPLLRPVVATTVVLLMILIWNEFFWAFFMLTGTSGGTLPLGLYYVQSQALYQVRWNLVFAHIVLVSLPLLIVYVFAQRRILSGLTGGALKG